MADEIKNNQEKTKQSAITKETLGVVISLFTTLCLICLITRDKVFFTPGKAVNAFFLGLFGWFSYVVLAGLLFLGVRLITGKKINISKKTIAITSLLIVCLAIFCHAINMGNTANYANYGEYLKLSYTMGSEGLKSSSAGGIVTALLAYPITLLLTVVGACVLTGLAIVYFTYYLVRARFNYANKPAKTVQFRSTYVKEDPPVQVEGEREYPIAGVVPNKSTNQRLFVNNPNDFGFKTKKDIAKNGDSEIKINHSISGMGVPSVGVSYSNQVSQEMQRKLDYIKTPSPINIERKLTSVNAEENKENLNAQEGGIRISDYIAKERDRSQRQVYDIQPKPAVDENKGENNDPVKPIANIEPIEPVKPELTAQEDAIDFTQRYVVEEPVPPQVKPEPSEIFIPNVERLEEQIKEEPKEENTDLDLDNPPPSVLNTRRSRDILFGEEKEEKEENNIVELESKVERLDFTSRVEKDGNNGVNPLIPNRRMESAPVPTPAPTPAINQEVKEEKPPKKIPPKNRKYNRPPLDLLETVTLPPSSTDENHEERIERIKNMLEDFKISVEPSGYIQGPSITRYEFRMPAGISVKRVLGYDDDLKMCLSSKNDVRIEAPIPGKNAIGIEVANLRKAPVGLRDILEDSAKDKNNKGALIFALGKDLIGKSITDDLAECKHFLVAGSTGSGKSVCMNVMLVSLIMRYSPEELRLILIDPKGVEFRPYEHIPHLMIDEIISEPKKALAVFHWAYEEMERRYKVFTECEGVVDIDGYNEFISNTDTPKMPRIAIFVDELSNLMETCKKEMDARILSIAQKARAAGIHLVLATQRPSVDVITGTIKANLPSRIALKLMTFADSNTIISEGGAEKLLGYGDMLYRNSGMSSCERYQGAFISRREVNNVVNYIKENNEAYFDDEMQEYLEKAVKPKVEDVNMPITDGESGGESEGSDLFKKALWLSVNSGTVAISQLQRRFQIGYAKAGGLVDKMERMGYVSGNEGSKARRVLLSVEEFIEKFGPVEDSY